MLEQPTNGSSPTDAFNVAPLSKSSAMIDLWSTSSRSSTTTTPSSVLPTNDLWKRKDQMMQTLTTQWQNNRPQREKILKTTQQHGEQMHKGLQNLGAKLQKGSTELLSTNEAKILKEQFQTVGTKLSQLNISKITGVLLPSPTHGGQNDLLMFNERMKEEAMRRDVRREAEAACLQTMKEHLELFLQEHEGGTYEQWIYAFHPENTQDVSLIMEYKEVDVRFYVEESDHRRLWNDMVNDPSRRVAARSTIFASPQGPSSIIDLLGEETQESTTSQPVLGDLFHDGALVASPAAPASTNVQWMEKSSIQHDVDLISF